MNAPAPMSKGNRRVTKVFVSDGEVIQTRMQFKQHFRPVRGDLLYVQAFRLL
jgi:hypothetical protein